MKNALSFTMLLALAAACAPALDTPAGNSSASTPVEPEQSVPLEDTVWELVSFLDAGTFISFGDQDYTLTFRGDGSVEAQLHCNSGGGSYTVDGDRLSFGPLFTTLMHCGDDSVAALYGRTLAEVEAFSIKGGELALTTASDSTLLYRPAGTAARPEPAGSRLRGGTWELLEIVRPAGEREVPQGTYALSFSDQGDELLVTADCNRGRGTFTLNDGGFLEIGPVGLTRMACPPGSISAEFAGLVGEAQQFSITEGILEIVTADSTVLRFGRD